MHGLISHKNLEGEDGVKREIVKRAAVYEHRICVGSRDILHLEAYVASFMDLYKKHTVQPVFVKYFVGLCVYQRWRAKRWPRDRLRTRPSRARRRSGRFFRKLLAGYVAPGLLFLGCSVVGYGLSTRRKWAVSGLASPNTQLSIMLLLMVADHGSSFWDHSRVSSEEYCLTSMITSSKTLDDTPGRLVFGGLGALLTGVAAYGMRS